MKDIILIGAGGHAASCIDVIESEGRFNIVGLIGKEEELGNCICDYRVFATDDELCSIIKKYSYALIVVGQIKTAKNRILTYNKIRDIGFEIPTIISPRAYVSKHAHIGAGSIIMHNSVINSDVIIGHNCIINSCALIEHGARIGDHSHVSTGSIINGNVKIGCATFIGSGALIKHGVSIGAHSFIGMAEVINRDIPSFTNHYPIPEKKRVLIIAEAGVNHNGNIEIARNLIESAADAGADIVKFQTFKADNLVIKDAAKADYQLDVALVNESQHEMLQRLELSASMHDELIRYASKCGIEFMSTAFDEPSLELLACKGLKRFKIPSGEITNLPYLRRVAEFAEEIIISTGMATLAEIGCALEVIEGVGISRDSITVLHCTTEYPASIQDINLRAMQTITQEFGVKVGYSDHTQGIEVPIAAVALGASVIEKHFTLDRSLPGPDHKASLEPEQLKAMIRSIRNIEKAIGDGIKAPSLAETKNLLIVRKSLVAACEIRSGELFTFQNIVAKRPGTGLSPMRINEIIGKVASRNFMPDELIEL